MFVAETTSGVCRGRLPRGWGFSGRFLSRKSPLCRGFWEGNPRILQGCYDFGSIWMYFQRNTFVARAVNSPGVPEEFLRAEKFLLIKCPAVVVRKRPIIQTIDRW